MKSRKQYRHLKILLEDYCEYYHAILSGLGYPDESREYVMMRLGVKRERGDEMCNGVFVGGPWSSNKETRRNVGEVVPGALQNWGSVRIRRVAIAVHEMPYADQRIVRTLYHPDRAKGMRNSDFCPVLNLSPASLGRRIRHIYETLNKKLNLRLDW